VKYDSNQIIAILISAFIIFRISYSEIPFINRLLIVILIVVAMRGFVLD
jgi:uncharacterized protein YacL